MRYSILAVVAVAGLAIGAPTSPLNNYEVQEASWEIEVAPGKAVVFNGTVQEVVKQLEDQYPEYAAKLHEQVAEAAEKEGVDAPAADVLTKRDHNVCRNWPVADWFWIRDGISYLRGVGGRPWLAAGPSKCARNNHRVELGSYTDIANAAYVIAEDCKFAGGGTIYTSGQRFHNDNINVIVRGDSC